MHRFLQIALPSLLGILLLFETTGCTGGLSAQQKRDATYIMGEKGVYLKKWRLVETYDPYNGGVLTPMDAEPQRYLVLFQDGDFLQYEEGMYNEGAWRVKTEEDKLAKLYRIQDNRPLDPSRVDSSYAYHVLLHTADSLIIGLQGRHGIYEMRYQQIPVSTP